MDKIKAEPGADVEAICVDGTSFVFRKMNPNNVQLVIEWEQEAWAHEWMANVSSDRVLTCSLGDLGKLKNEEWLDDVAVKRKVHTIHSLFVCLRPVRIEDNG